MSHRIFHLIKSLGRGGAEVLLAEGLAVADQSRFAYGYGYFLPWKDAVVPELEAQGAPVTCFEASSNLAIVLAARRVAQHLRAWQADLVHAHLPVAGVVARLAGWLAGVPVLYTEHNLLEHYHPVTRTLNVATWRLQAHAVAVSADVEASIRTHAGDRVPVQTVLNGVNVRAFDPALYDGEAVRTQWGIPKDAPVVGTIAVFRAQKRLDDWVRVAQQIRRAVPDAQFILVGDGGLRPQLERYVQEAGLGEVVHLVGLQDEVRPYLAAMDVYLMTSEFEGLPIALLEAMAMGVPPVVTAVGGIPELVTSGVNGALHPQGVLDALAASVTRMLQDAAKRGRLGQAARRTVAQRFSMERMQRELEAIYAGIIETRATNHFVKARASE